MTAQIDLSNFTKTSIDDLNALYKEDSRRKLADVRIYVAPCKRQINTAIDICISAASSTNSLDYYVRVDDRLPASCCSDPSRLQRLSSLISWEKLHGFQTRWLDRMWLEQRLYDIDGDLDADPVTLDNLLENKLVNVYGCTDVTKPLAAIFLIGECGLISKVLNTRPFSPSPRIPKPNEFFQCGPDGSETKYNDFRLFRHFLGSFDVNGSHQKAKTLEVPLSPPASPRSLKRGLETGSSQDSSAKRVSTRSEFSSST